MEQALDRMTWTVASQTVIGHFIFSTMGSYSDYSSWQAWEGAPQHRLLLTWCSCYCCGMSNLPTCPTWNLNNIVLQNQPDTVDPNPYNSKREQWSSWLELVYIPGMDLPFLVVGPCALYYLTPYRVFYSLKQDTTRYCFRPGANLYHRRNGSEHMTKGPLVL